ncbi:RecB family endonuclease NucS [Arcanobacterium wilhelmae]|uniref:Endonuclease NucS n=1 Tax=Arcanobacterium wilhelmae TaxID=1803177 RepID=A0ABT9N9X0_9ACTO|nr:endonuclease NucS [Arcanobacterium wilhelmae]MDP9800499.1 RecB family endonuclease NucS [Arcanobacterium wilhelmae]WFN89918.1 endonuclease NucS [Arcanobacterium wilhelmae]
MRVVIAECSVDYSGRLDAHLDRAKRLLIVKPDGGVMIHSDGGSYKPLNWMSAPCTTRVLEPDEEQVAAGIKSVWRVDHDKTSDALVISFYDKSLDYEEELGEEPGLIKDGVEAHLQELLAAQTSALGADLTLVRREYPTAIGPVDLMLTDAEGVHIAVEVKRRGEIDGVEQLTRYLDLLGRDSTLQPLRGIFAAQEIKPQARVLAEDRGIECVVVDYDALRGLDDAEDRLF